MKRFDSCEHLFESRLYREDQHSFLLYPEKTLPAFLERNRIPAASVHAVPLLRGTGRWRAMPRSWSAMRSACFTSMPTSAMPAISRWRSIGSQRRSRWAAPVARDRGAVLEVFEEVFHHRSYTGRSGTMYGYEGLGCVYWHMVAKLLLAVQEIVLREDEAPEREALARLYGRIRAGLGFAKTPAEYGAFPTDPYSHTPRHAGAQQPGMTGQVKEEILTRFGELGVEVTAGAVRFRPVLLERGEFLDEPAVLRCHDVRGKETTIEVPAGSLAFTFCQVPVVYQVTRDEAWIRVTARDGTALVQPGDCLDVTRSRALLDRSGAITRIDVSIPERRLIAR